MGGSVWRPIAAATKGNSVAKSCAKPPQSLSITGGTVTKTVVLIVVTVAILQSLLVPVAEAQTQSCQTTVVCSIYSLYYGVCIPLLPLGAHNCTSNGPWSAICELPTYLCIPTPCPTCAAAAAQRPIDLATGNTYIEESDLRIPGLGGGLALSRTWNSQTPSLDYSLSL